MMDKITRNLICIEESNKKGSLSSIFYSCLLYHILMNKSKSISDIIYEGKILEYADFFIIAVDKK